MYFTTGYLIKYIFVTHTASVGFNFACLFVCFRYTGAPYFAAISALKLVSRLHVLLL